MNKTKLISLNYPFEPKKPEILDLEDCWKTISLLEIINSFYKENNISLKENILDIFPKFTLWIQEQINNKRYKLSLFSGEFNSDKIGDYNFYERVTYSKFEIEQEKNKYIEKLKEYNLEISNYKIEKVICHNKNIQKLLQEKNKESDLLLNEITSYKGNLDNFIFYKDNNSLVASYKEHYLSSNLETENLMIESYYGDFELTYNFEESFTPPLKVHKIKITNFSIIEKEPELLFNVFLNDFSINFIKNNPYYKELIFAIYCNEKLNS